jgi:hypothetical protein
LFVSLSDVASDGSPGGAYLAATMAPSKLDFICGLRLLRNLKNMGGNLP